MSQAPRLRKQMEKVREVTEGMLQAFQTPEQWTFQVQPGLNHALWCAGHMVVTDNFFLSMVAPSKASTIEGYQEKFGMGSSPTSDPSAYPPAAEVLDQMRERRQTLLAVLDSLGDDELLKPTPEDVPDMFSDIGSIFEMAIWHEAMHTGQISIARRALGNEPLFVAPPAAAKA